MSQLDALVDALGDIETITREKSVRQKSRDYFWYSPVLQRQLDNCTGDIVILPRSVDEVRKALSVCYQASMPVTVRSGGTGNYGQAVPLKGGAILDVSTLTAIKAIERGRVVCEPGVRILDLDNATQAHSQQELRFHPSTRKLGTIGGFIAGGSSGIGSITWGLLADPGNVLALKVLTMEAEPRLIELRGPEVNKVMHAYGTNGVVVEVEMPLAPAYPWQEIIVGFDDFMQAARYADSLSASSGILKKLVTPIAAPVPQQYFRILRNHIPTDTHIVICMIAPMSMDAFNAHTVEAGGRVLYSRSEIGPEDRPEDRIPPLFEFTWNHTTLHALKIDRTVTYLQSLFPPGDHLERVEHMYHHFGDEVPMHLEFVRFQGQVACFGLQLVRYTSEERLEEIIRYHDDHGVPIFNPHRYTLEEGGMKTVDEAQLAFKREADAAGLLNPGKMLAWENPDYDGRNSGSLMFNG